jgi:hypothetical protein
LCPGLNLKLVVVLGLAILSVRSLLLVRWVACACRQRPRGQGWGGAPVQENWQCDGGVAAIGRLTRRGWCGGAARWS